MKQFTSQELIEKAKVWKEVTNEGGEGYNPYSEELEKRYMEEKKGLPSFEEEWTKSATQARRAEWNAYVKSLGSIPVTELIKKTNERQKNQGWNMLALKKALGLHGLA